MERNIIMMFFRISLILLVASMIIIFIVDEDTPEFVVTIISLVTSGGLAIVSLLYAIWKGKQSDKNK